MQHDHEREVAMFGECVTCAAETIPDTVSTSRPLGDRAHARTTHPATAHIAAGTINPQDLTDSRLDVLNLFLDHGEMTLEQLVDAAHAANVGYSDSRIRSAAAELVSLTILYDTGRVVPTRAGRPARVLGFFSPSS